MGLGSMQGLKRRLVYLTAYEAIAIALSATAMAVVYGVAPGDAGLLSVIASGIAISWNWLYNAGFEWWESRQAQKGRGLGRRVLHAVGFEFGLVLVLVPLLAAWLGISLVEAFVLDLGLIVFFLVYTFVFNLAFDRLFGLPASAA